MQTATKPKPKIIHSVPKPQPPADEQAKLLEDWNFAWTEVEKAYQVLQEKKRLAETIQAKLRRSVQQVPDYAE